MMEPSIRERLNLGSPQSVTEVMPAAKGTFGSTVRDVEAVGSSSVNDITALISIVSRLDLNDELMMKTVQFAVVHFCMSGAAMQLCIQRFHDLAMIDPIFGKKSAAALSTASNLVVDGQKLRNVLITCLQNDFAKSEDVRKSNKNLFMNMVGFLGQVFSHLKVNDEPIKVLSIPHLIYQKRLLDGDETEVELCMLLLAQNGQILERCQPTSTALLSEFFLTMTVRLIQNDIEKRTRAWMMLAIQMKSSSYKITSEFYVVYISVLGTESMARISAALTAAQLRLPIDFLEEKSLQALKAGPPEEGCGENLALNSAPSGGLRTGGRMSGNWTSKNHEK